MTPQEKQQLKARFFGMHLGCKMQAVNSIGQGEYVLSGTSTLNEGALMLFTEDGGSFSSDVTECKLILRPLSSITITECRQIVDSLPEAKTSSIHEIEEAALIFYNELTSIDSIHQDSPFEFVDRLRSINICLPFMGIDPVAENWAIL